MNLPLGLERGALVGVGLAEDLVLVGAGGLGRETAEAIRARNAIEPTWNLLGFLDDGPTFPASVSGIPVLGPVTELKNLPAVKVVLCTGRPDFYWSRKQLASRLALPQSRYATIVHPAAELAPSARIGAGSIVLAGVVATTDVEIGAHVAIMPNCVFTHDDRIGDHSTFGAGVRLAGGVVVGEGAYVGSGALVREKTSIGAWSLLGMGSVVLNDIPAGQVWIGAPARLLRHMDLPADLFP